MKRRDSFYAEHTAQSEMILRQSKIAPQKRSAEVRVCLKNHFRDQQEEIVTVYATLKQ